MEEKKRPLYGIESIRPIEIELSDVIAEMRLVKDAEEARKKLEEAERKLQEL